MLVLTCKRAVYFTYHLVYHVISVCVRTMISFIPMHYGYLCLLSWRRIRRLLFCVTFDFLRMCTTCLRKKFRVFSWEISIRFLRKIIYVYKIVWITTAVCRLRTASHYECRKRFRKYSGPFLEISIAKTSLNRRFRWTDRGCIYAPSCWRWIRGRRR